MTDLAIFVAGLGVGFFASAHCVAMCGGICSALSFALPAGRPWLRLRIVLGYNIGRIFSYVLMAVLFTGLSVWLAKSFGPEVTKTYLSSLRLVAGILLIAMGLYLASWWLGLQKLEQAGQILWRKIAPITQKLTPVKRVATAIIFGAVWGWLPCGLVYSALTLAIAQGTINGAAITMLGFGLGTLPAVLATGLLAERVQYFLNNRYLKRFFALFLIAFGVWTIAYSGGHQGHQGQHSPNQEQPAGHHHH